VGNPDRTVQETASLLLASTPEQGGERSAPPLTFCVVVPGKIDYL
jgi:hypothetical protein